MADGQVFVGLPDEKIGLEDDSLCTWSTNKFGGRPNWMSTLVGEYPSCKLCTRKLFLVSQIYCPLSDSEYHRTLYVFGCVSVSCWNRPQSWTILRSQVQERTSKTRTMSSNKAPVNCSSAEDWGIDAGDLGEDADDWNDTMVSELEYAASKLSLNTSSPVKETLGNTNWGSKSLSTYYMNQEVPCFQPYYINVFESPKSNIHVETHERNLTSHEKELLLRYQEQEGMSLTNILSVPNQSIISKHECNVTEAYERTIVAHGDKGFHKFQKYLKQYPQQCIRYEWNGTPLSISSSTSSSDIMLTVPCCQYCGSQRVYELQLMPALVVLLQIQESSLTSTLSDVSTTSNISLQNAHISDIETISVEKKCGEGSINVADISARGQGIEFGTVIVFTCSKSCWSETDDSCVAREEYVVVHSDPDTELFQNKNF